MKSHLLSAEADAAVTILPAADVMKASLATRRFLTTLINLFSAFCVMLAAFGLYGVMSYITTQRFHEIAVRMAMGATSSRIARSVIGHAAALAMLGMAVGVVLANIAQRLAATRVETAGLYGAPFAFAVALLLTTVAVAAWLPAARAARINPAVSLRQE
jgi:ABC-type antimicrobial peptide transport system permease subunit